MTELLHRLAEQVEYYFSEANLARDTFLVGLLDRHFFTPIAFLATFNRVRSICPDPNVLARAIALSSVLELDVSGTCVRPRNWQNLVRVPAETGIVIRVRDPNVETPTIIVRAPLTTLNYFFPQPAAAAQEPPAIATSE